MHWIDALKFEPLVARLHEIDVKLTELATDISASPNPDGEGLFDDAEDLAGEGFLQCQLYMIERKGELRATRPNPYLCGPKFAGRFVAEIINVAGNYRKHRGEWPQDENNYRPEQRKTVAMFTDVGVASTDYWLSNLLFELTSTTSAPGQFATIVPLLIEWREAVDLLLG